MSHWSINCVHQVNEVHNGNIFFTNDEKMEHVNEFIHFTGGRKMEKI